jgi:hypothetical protein
MAACEAARTQAFLPPSLDWRVNGASRARRWPARRGTSRGTGGREIPVQSALQAQFAVLSMQVAALRRTRVPLVKRRSDCLRAAKHARYAPRSAQRCRFGPTQGTDDRSPAREPFAFRPLPSPQVPRSARVGEPYPAPARSSRRGCDGWPGVGLPSQRPDTARRRPSAFQAGRRAVGLIQAAATARTIVKSDARPLRPGSESKGIWRTKSDDAPTGLE